MATYFPVSNARLLCIVCRVAVNTALPWKDTYCGGGRINHGLRWGQTADGDFTLILRTASAADMANVLKLLNATLLLLTLLTRVRGAVEYRNGADGRSRNRGSPIMAPWFGESGCMHVMFERSDVKRYMPFFH